MLTGREVGRGPDNEPLISEAKPVAWIAEDLLHAAETLVDELGDGDWGPMDRGQ